MRMIAIAIVIATVGWGCPKEKAAQVDLDAALAGIKVEAAPERAVRDTCPEPEPCPQCESVDAVYYSTLHRIEHGRPESAASTAFVHRGGQWYLAARVFPDQVEGPGAVPEVDLAVADALLAHVRAHPADVGIKTIAGDEYVQRGRVLTGWQAYDRIEGAPGIRASLATVFVLLE